jgi:hypothetical protein
VDGEEEGGGGELLKGVEARTKMIGVRNTVRWRWRSEGDGMVSAVLLL